MSFIAPPPRTALLLLVLALAWGAWIRLADLGANPLASDEMNHYYVASAIQDGGEPVLPSGVGYGRGLDYSTMVAFTLGRVEPAETAVRLPSAIIGVLCLVAFALISWRMAGPWPAFLATLLLVLYPEAVRLSRFGRFYTLQLLAGLLAMYCGWRVVRNPLAAADSTIRGLAGKWGWILATLLAFGYAVRIQVTTLSVAAGWALAVAIAGIVDLRRNSRDAWRWSAAWQLTVLGIVTMVVLLALAPATGGDLLQRARSMPMWARLGGGTSDILAYYRLLSSSFPLVISLAPLVFLVAILRDRRTGWFLLAWFAVPVLLHSGVFAWKSERYILLAVPALLLAAGMAAAAGVNALAQWLRDRTPESPWAQRAAILAIIGIVAVAVITTPAFNASRKMPSARVSNGWAESRRIIARDPELGGLPLGSAMPLEALHYWGRVDFVVQKALLESWTPDAARPEGRQIYHMNPMGSPDLYAGRPTLTTPEAIRERFMSQGAVIIGIQQKYLDYNNIEASLRDTLEREADELCQDRCGVLRLYYWRFR